MIQLSVLYLFSAKIESIPHILGYRLRFYLEYKTFFVCLWKSTSSFDSWKCEGMRSRALTFEASGIDHVGLIQICFSPAATVSRVSEKTVYLFRWYSPDYAIFHAQYRMHNEILKNHLEKVLSIYELTTMLVSFDKFFFISDMFCFVFLSNLVKWITAPFKHAILKDNELRTVGFARESYYTNCTLL